MDTRHPISTITIMGDSLSDRGTMYDRYLFGVIPMRYPSKLAGAAPDKRFTNGLSWVDHLSVMLLNKGTIEILKNQYHLLPEEIADAVINRESRYQALMHQAYSLDNDKRIKYLGKNAIETYTEGGLTSSDYSCMPSCNIVRFFKRMILTNLDAMREKLLADDKKQLTTLEDKQKTLIIEWSGANDLVTVNREPSKAEVDRAIKSRIKNIEALMAAGYQHFVLFNMPDLSLTPKFQAGSQSQRDKAHRASIYFNDQLNARIRQLQADHPEKTFSVFDVCTELTRIFNDPASVGLDPAKKLKPYIHSDDFKLKRDKTSPAAGYLFWDDLHPTADVHAGLANHFYQQYVSHYAIDLWNDSISVEPIPNSLRHSIG